jgi:hypothetical protein
MPRCHAPWFNPTERETGDGRTPSTWGGVDPQAELVAESLRGARAKPAPIPREFGLRLARVALCIMGVAGGLLAVGAAAAGAATPSPTGSFVTCSTPPVTRDGVTIASARAERGSTLTAMPGESCVRTEGIVDAVPAASHTVGDRVRALSTTGSSATSLAVVAIAAVLIAFGVPAAFGWRTRSRTSEDAGTH